MKRKGIKILYITQHNEEGPYVSYFVQQETTISGQAIIMTFTPL